jgi:hypothetical protein
MRIEELPLIPIVKGIRKAIYTPLIVLAYLPGGPMRHLWAIRAMVWIDRPFATYIIKTKVSSP